MLYNKSDLVFPILRLLARFLEIKATLKTRFLAESPQLRQDIYSNNMQIF